MLYLLIRIIIVVLTFLPFLVYKKRYSNIRGKKCKFIMAGLFVIIFYSLLLIPFENMMIKFRSPIDAFEYSYLNKNIIQVVEDGNCAFIVYEQDESSVFYTAFKNQEGGWKIHSPYITSRISLKSFEQYHIVIYDARDCNKELIIVSEGNLSEPRSNIEISDNKNSQFKSFFSKYRYVDYYTVFHYTIIDSAINDYKLVINGENIDID